MVPTTVTTPPLALLTAHPLLEPAVTVPVMEMVAFPLTKIPSAEAPDPPETSPVIVIVPAPLNCTPLAIAFPPPVMLPVMTMVPVEELVSAKIVLVVLEPIRSPTMVTVVPLA